MEKQLTREQKKVLKVLRKRAKELLSEPPYNERAVYVRDTRGKVRPTRIRGV